MSTPYAFGNFNGGAPIIATDPYEAFLNTSAQKPMMATGDPYSAFANTLPVTAGITPQQAGAGTANYLSAPTMSALTMAPASLPSTSTSTGAPSFLMPRQVPYAPMPTNLGLFGQQAYNLAGTPPQTEARSYNLSAPLAPFEGAGAGSGSSGGGGEWAGLLGLLAQNPNLLSNLVNAGKGLLGGGTTPASVPGSMLDTAQKAKNLSELLPNAVNPPLINPSDPLADPEIVEAIKPTAQIPSSANVPGSMLDTAQNAKSLAELFPNAVNPPMIEPSAPTIDMNPAVDRAITQAGQGGGGSLSSLLSPGASTPTLISPSAPAITMNPAVDAAITQAAGAAGGAGAAAIPGSMLSIAQSGAPLSSILAGTTPTLISPSALTVGMNPAVDAAITQAAAGQGAGLGGSLAGLAGPAALIAGGLLAGQGISKGKEGQAALGGGIAGAGASLMGLGALGPLGLAGAAIAAVGASLVNTREFGDVALRNYWNAVDSGRGIGQTDPVELAQGFINFYRTNKNEFPGQARYGRTGNEEFMQDFKTQINSAIEQGAVSASATPQEIHAKVIQPWLDTMGQGPQNAEARAIQDFMMQDLIASYQRGAPISNAEVKNDRKFAIVSNPLRYPASPTPGAATMGAPGIDLSGDMMAIPPDEDVLGRAAAAQQPSSDMQYRGLLAQVANATPVDSPYYGLLSQWRTV